MIVKYLKSESYSGLTVHMAGVPFIFLKSELIRMYQFAKDRTVIHLDLTGCPEGPIFDEHHPNFEIDSYFKGFANPLGCSHNQSALLYVKYEEGAPIIYHPVGYPGQYPHRYGVDRFLVGGEYDMRDYVVEADIALDSYMSTATADNSVHVRAMAGVFGRFTDNRHYYYLCLEGVGNGTCVLYYRNDDSWNILDKKAMTVKLGQYYHLELRCWGDQFNGLVNGEEMVSAVDYSQPYGKLGFRFSAAGRAKNFAAGQSAGQQVLYQKHHNEILKDVNEVSAEYPELCLLGTADFSKYMPFRFRIVDLPGGSKGYLVMGCEKTALTDLSGKILWEQDIAGYFPHITSPWEGSFDITGISGDKVTAIDGATGRIKRQIICPVDNIPELIPRYRYEGWIPTAVNLRGTPVARDLLVRSNESPASAGSVLYAYDDNLEPLWEIKNIYPPYGHYYSFAFFDMDGNGRESVFPGCSRYTPDGELVWQLDHADDIASFNDGLHVDANIIGNFSGDPNLDPILYCAGGSAGVYAINARTGNTIVRHNVGHAQAICAGRFLPDVGETTIAAYTRWANYGIVILFDAYGNRIRSFQPDNVTEGGPIVNWTGNGIELMLVCAGGNAMGLYDGYGRRLVQFPKEIMEYFYRPSGRYCDQIFSMPVGKDPRDNLFFNINGVIHRYGPDCEVDLSRPLFTPTRRMCVSTSGWTRG